MVGTFDSPKGAGSFRIKVLMFRPELKDYSSFFSKSYAVFIADTFANGTGLTPTEFQTQSIKNPWEACPNTVYWCVQQTPEHYRVYWWETGEGEEDGDYADYMHIQNNRGHIASLTSWDENERVRRRFVSACPPPPMLTSNYTVCQVITSQLWNLTAECCWWCDGASPQCHVSSARQMNVKDRWCHRSTVTSTEGSRVQINSWKAFRRATLATKEFTPGRSFIGNTASPPPLKALHCDLFGDGVFFFSFSVIQSWIHREYFIKRGDYKTISLQMIHHSFEQKTIPDRATPNIKMYAISVLLVLSLFSLHVNEKNRDNSDLIREACQPLQT